MSTIKKMTRSLRTDISRGMPMKRRRNPSAEVGDLRRVAETEARMLGTITFGTMTIFRGSRTRRRQRAPRKRTEIPRSERIEALALTLKSHLENKELLGVATVTEWAGIVLSTRRRPTRNQKNPRRCRRGSRELLVGAMAGVMESTALELRIKAELQVGARAERLKTGTELGSADEAERQPTK